MLFSNSEIQEYDIYTKLLSRNYKYAIKNKISLKFATFVENENRYENNKRDNSVVDFNIQKIYNAVNAAFVDTMGVNAPNSLLLHIKETFDVMPDEKVMHVEEVQDYIEEILMDRRYHDNKL